MGAKTSTNITQTTRQEVVNDTDLKLIKNNTYKNIMNQINKDASVCAANSAQLQDIKAKIGKIHGDWNITGTTQKQSSMLDFSCVNVQNMTDDFASDIGQEFSDNLTTNYDTTALAELGANADSAAKSGFLPLSSTTSDSNVNQNTNINISNKINKTIQTGITNEIKKNFTSEKLNSCVSNASQKQKQDYESEEVMGNVNMFNLSQEQALNTVTNCVQEDVSLNKTIDKIGTVLNTISNDGVKTTTASSDTGKASSSAIAQGFNDLIDGILDAFTGPFKWLIIGGIIIAIGIVIFLMSPAGQKATSRAMDIAEKKMKGGDIVDIINNLYDN